jgi:uncharacterized protein (TIGR02328 family)
MRLWHKDLIPVLPRQQLLGQWRECCLIAKNIAEKGTPNHILVNKIMEYPIEHFIAYTSFVREEMLARGYKCKGENFTKYFKPWNSFVIYYEDVFSNWHNHRYFDQCYYNLQEKYDCGGISEREWKTIQETKHEYWKKVPGQRIDDD